MAAAGAAPPSPAAQHTLTRAEQRLKCSCRAKVRAKACAAVSSAPLASCCSKLRGLGWCGRSEIRAEGVYTAGQNEAERAAEACVRPEAGEREGRTSPAQQGGGMGWCCSQQQHAPEQLNQVAVLQRHHAGGGGEGWLDIRSVGCGGARGPPTTELDVAPGRRGDVVVGLEAIQWIQAWPSATTHSIADSNFRFARRRKCQPMLGKVGPLTQARARPVSRGRARRQSRYGWRCSVQTPRHARGPKISWRRST